MFHPTYIKLFIYIMAAFIGISNILFLIFLNKYKNSGNKRLYKATRNFTLSALLLVIMYFFFLFIRFIFGELSNNAALRVLDILSFLGLKYFWLKIMLAIIVGTVGRKLHRTVDVMFLIFTALCVINFGFFMDSQYYIADTAVRSYVTVVSILLSTVPLGVNIYIIIKYYHQMVNRVDKIFIIVNSILIHQNACWNAIMAISLYSGRILLSTWNTPITDPTSVFLLLINLTIFIFIYRTDFSPLFKLSFTEQPGTGTVTGSGERFGTRTKSELAPGTNTESEPIPGTGAKSEPVKGQFQQGGLAEEETGAERDNRFIIDILSLKHALTVREREIAILVYQGYTNPDIAERLFISKNTVRNHIHNIFYKLDISSRMELVHLINSQK